MANTIDADEDERVTQLEGYAGNRNTERREFQVSRVDPSLAPALLRVEIDNQVATARAYPRDVELAVRKIYKAATFDVETAEECIYALPRGDKPIRGPSIRFAEIIFQNWGNCRSTSAVVQVDRFNKVVVAEGTYQDLESNAATKATKNRRIVNKSGGLYNDDMIITTSDAACAIARRNAILGGVPKAYWRKAYDECERIVKGDVKTLTERRDKAIKAFAQFGVKPEQIYEALKIKDIGDVTLEHMPVLRGMFQALKSEEETVESMFGAPTKAKEKVDPETGEITTESETKERSALDELAGDGEASGSDAGKQPAEPSKTGVSGGSAGPTEGKKPRAEPIRTGVGDTGEEPEKVPTTPAEYTAHFEKWFANTANPVDAAKKWQAEKPLRNKLKVPVAERDRMKDLVETALTSGKKS